MAFKSHSNFYEEKKEQTENNILKEMDEHFYKKFRYKELNNSKIIILQNRKQNEQMCNSILSTYTPLENKNLKVDFPSEYGEVCTSCLGSPVLRDKKNDTQVSRFSIKKKTNLRVNKYNSSQNDSINDSETKKKKNSILSSLKSKCFNFLN